MSVDRAILRGGAAPVNEIRVVEVLESDDDTVTVGGDGLPGGRETMTVRRDGGWSLADVPQSLADLSIGHYVICRDDGEFVVRDVSKIGIFGSIFDAPIVHRGPLGALKGVEP